VELNASNRKALYIPRGFAHGSETLVDNTEALYCISNYFVAENSSGINYAATGKSVNVDLALIGW